MAAVELRVLRTFPSFAAAHDVLTQLQVKREKTLPKKKFLEM
jgi:hypothetical protein